MRKKKQKWLKKSSLLQKNSNLLNDALKDIKSGEKISKSDTSFRKKSHCDKTSRVDHLGDVDCGNDDICEVIFHKNKNCNLDKDVNCRKNTGLDVSNENHLVLTENCQHDVKKKKKKEKRKDSVDERNISKTAQNSLKDKSLDYCAENDETIDGIELKDGSESGSNRNAFDVHSNSLSLDKHSKKRFSTSFDNVTKSSLNKLDHGVNPHSSISNRHGFSFNEKTRASLPEDGLMLSKKKPSPVVRKIKKANIDKQSCEVILASKERTRTSSESERVKKKKIDKENSDIILASKERTTIITSPKSGSSVSTKNSKTLHAAVTERKNKRKSRDGLIESSNCERLAEEAVDDLNLDIELDIGSSGCKETNGHEAVPSVCRFERIVGSDTMHSYSNHYKSTENEGIVLEEISRFDDNVQSNDIESVDNNKNKKKRKSDSIKDTNKHKDKQKKVNNCNVGKYTQDSYCQEAGGEMEFEDNDHSEDIDDDNDEDDDYFQDLGLIDSGVVETIEYETARAGPTARITHLGSYGFHGLCKRFFSKQFPPLKEYYLLPPFRVRKKDMKKANFWVIWKERLDSAGVTDEELDNDWGKRMKYLVDYFYYFPKFAEGNVEGINVPDEFQRFDKKSKDANFRGPYLPTVEELETMLHLTIRLHDNEEPPYNATSDETCYKKFHYSPGFRENYRMGHFIQKEMDIVSRNWESFKQVYKICDPRPLVSHMTYIIQGNSEHFYHCKVHYISKRQEYAFLMYLLQGITKRHISQMYCFVVNTMINSSGTHRGRRWQFMADAITAPAPEATTSVPLGDERIWYSWTFRELRMIDFFLNKYGTCPRMVMQYLLPGRTKDALHNILKFYMLARYPLRTGQWSDREMLRLLDALVYESKDLRWLQRSTRCWDSNSMQTPTEYKTDWNKVANRVQTRTPRECSTRMHDMLRQSLLVKKYRENYPDTEIAWTIHHQKLLVEQICASPADDGSYVDYFKMTKLEQFRPFCDSYLKLKARTIMLTRVPDRKRIYFADTQDYLYSHVLPAINRKIDSRTPAIARNMKSFHRLADKIPDHFSKYIIKMFADIPLRDDDEDPFSNGVSNTAGGPTEVLMLESDDSDDGGDAEVLAVESDDDGGESDGEVQVLVVENAAAGGSHNSAQENESKEAKASRKKKRKRDSDLTENSSDVSHRKTKKRKRTIEDDLENVGEGNSENIRHSHDDMNLPGKKSKKKSKSAEDSTESPTKSSDSSTKSSDSPTKSSKKKKKRRRESEENCADLTIRRNENEECEDSQEISRNKSKNNKYENYRENLTASEENSTNLSSKKNNKSKKKRERNEYNDNSNPETSTKKKSRTEETESNVAAVASASKKSKKKHKENSKKKKSRKPLLTVEQIQSLESGDFSTLSRPLKCSETFESKMNSNLPRVPKKKCLPDGKSGSRFAKEFGSVLTNFQSAEFVEDSDSGEEAERREEVTVIDLT